MMCCRFSLNILFLLQAGQQGGGGGFSMPVTVPVNSSSYPESSLLTSPQQSVSPRPPSHDMLEVSQSGAGGGQYPASAASPLSPAPGHAASASSPSPQSLKRCATSPDSGGGQQQLSVTQMAANRNNLRVVIPGSGGREAADSGLGAGLGYGHNHGHGGNFQSDFGEVQHWNQSHLQLNNHK